MIDIELFNIFNKVCRPLFKQPHATINILSLGFPSVFLPNEFAMQYNLDTRLPNNSIEKRIKQVMQRFGHNCDYYDFESVIKSLFGKTKYNFQCLDIAKNQYPGVIWDLNMPIPHNYYNKYDLIIDSGSLEHCFNIGTAFRNIARMIKTNGFIISAIPYFSPGHGYYNITPILLQEFYCRQNGFDLIFLKCKSSNNFPQSLLGKAELLFTLKSLKDGSVNKIVTKMPINTMYYVAKKINSVIPEFVLQSKYR